MLKNSKFPIIFLVFCSVAFNTVKAAPTLDTVISFSDRPITDSTIVYIKLKPLNTDFSGKIDCLLSLSEAILTNYGDYACGIRFKNINERDYNSSVDVYDANATGYTLTDMGFTLELPVFFWIDVDVGSQSYSVHATQDSAFAPVLIAENFGFRNSATNYISHMGIHANDQQPNVLNSIIIMNYGFVSKIGEYAPAPVKLKDKMPKGPITLQGVCPHSEASISKFQYRITEPTTLLFSVHELNGKKIQSFKAENKLPGEYFFALNRNQFQPGLYFYSLRTGKNSLSGKILIK